MGVTRSSVGETHESHELERWNGTSHVSPMFLFLCSLFFLDFYSLISSKWEDIKIKIDYDSPGPSSTETGPSKSDHQSLKNGSLKKSSLTLTTATYESESVITAL